MFAFHQRLNSLWWFIIHKNHVEVMGSIALTQWSQGSEKLFDIFYESQTFKDRIQVSGAQHTDVSTPTHGH